MTHIVVTNDDGVHAPGILALTKAMREIGEITVIAPARNQSASGHKKTLFQDIPIEETTLEDGTPAIAVHGSPADCIALAALGLTTWPPRLVVSGINPGANMGQDVTYSGTVTAALEATINGAPAVAVSLEQRDADKVEDYQTAARIAQQVVRRTLEKALPAFTVLNLNVPRGNAVKGIRIVRQGIRIYRDELAREGNICRIVGPEPTGIVTEEGTDMWAVYNGYASLTPIHLDLTAHRFLADISAWDIDMSGVNGTSPHSKAINGAKKKVK
jgi:5'-nucleotidase